MAIEKNTGFRVAIIGGGIGGLTASLFLHHACGAGVSVDVFEQAREFKEIGNGLGLGLNAMRLLNKIGVGRACEAITGRMNDIWFTFCQGDSGEVITTVRSPAAEDTKPVAMARSEFLDVLLGFVKSRSAATLHTNKKCIEIKVDLLASSVRDPSRWQLTGPGSRKCCPDLIRGWHHSRGRSCAWLRWHSLHHSSPVSPG